MSWTAYAPEGGEPPPPCSFCGDPERQVTVALSGAAICEQCAERIADIMRRAGTPPPSPPPIDPRDPGAPIEVSLGGRPLGDLGNPRADARLLLAIALRDERVAAWLRERGIDEAAIRRDFGELELGFEA